MGHRADLCIVVIEKKCFPCCKLNCNSLVFPVCSLVTMVTDPVLVGSKYFTEIFFSVNFMLKNFTIEILEGVILVSY
jgi:hypothetical protein